MIPHGLKEEHFLQAADQIDDEGVPSERKSYHYDLILRGKPYPPKYVLSLASKFATGVEHPSYRFNAVEAKNYFLARSYKVVDRRDNAASVIVSEDDESTFPEGKVQYRRHRSLERDATIVRKAKVKRLEKSGGLQCDVCSLDFKESYGSRGEGFIEAHHTLPVATLGGGVKTKLSDIALVCSNCHRMLHRGRKMLSISELRKIVHDRQTRKRRGRGH